MNIGQMARTQQMIYRFVDRNLDKSKQSSPFSRLSSMNASSVQRQQQENTSALWSALTASTEKNGDPTVDSFLQKIGVSGSQGRTYREMAQYQLRNNTQNGSAAQKTAKEQTRASLLDPTSQTQRQSQLKQQKLDELQKQSARFSVKEPYAKLSAETTEKIQKLAVEDAKNSTQKKTSQQEKADSEKRMDTIRKELNKVDPSKRAATLNSMNKVWQEETDRLGAYIKEKDANWKDWGDSFDTTILNNYKLGVSVWT